MSVSVPAVPDLDFVVNVKGLPVVLDGAVTLLYVSVKLDPTVHAIFIRMVHGPAPVDTDAMAELHAPLTAT